MAHGESGVSLSRQSTYLEAAQLLQDALEYLLRLPAIPTTAELAKRIERHLAGGAHTVAVEDALRVRQTTVHAWAQGTGPVVPLLEVDLFQDALQLRLPTLGSQHSNEQQERTLLARLRSAEGERLALNWGPRPPRSLSALSELADPDTPAV